MSLLRQFVLGSPFVVNVIKSGGQDLSEEAPKVSAITFRGRTVSHPSAMDGIPEIAQGYAQCYLFRGFIEIIVDLSVPATYSIFSKEARELLTSDLCFLQVVRPSNGSK